MTTNEPMSEAEQKPLFDAIRKQYDKSFHAKDWPAEFATKVMPIIETHYAQPTHPVDGELPSIIDLMFEIRKYWAVSGEPELKEFAQYVQGIIAAHLQAAVEDAKHDNICWQENGHYTSCDRVKNHKGLHSWQIVQPTGEK